MPEPARDPEPTGTRPASAEPVTQASDTAEPVVRTLTAAASPDDGPDRPGTLPAAAVTGTVTGPPSVASWAQTAAAGAEQIPGYAIEGELGRGGMGVVFKARDVHLNRPVALKVTLGHVDQRAVIRFLAEAEAAAAVRHPHVVQVYAFGEHAGRSWPSSSAPAAPSRTASAPVHGLRARAFGSTRSSPRN